MHCSSKPLVWATLTLGSLCGPAHVSSAKDNNPCPDLSGHYRLAELGDVSGDAVKVLRIEMAGFTDSEVRFERSTGQDWNLFIKSGSTEVLTSRPVTTLVHGTDFTCQSGSVAPRAPARALPGCCW